MISQTPISSAPISIIIESPDKEIFYFVNSCRTVVVDEDTRDVYVIKENRTVEVNC